MRVKRWQNLLRFVDAGAFLDEIVVLAITIERCLADNAAAFDARMVLRARKWIFFSDFRDLHALDVLAIRDREMRIRRSAQKIRVESGFFRDRRGFLSAVTERDRDRIVSVTRRNVGGDDQLAPNR